MISPEKVNAYRVIPRILVAMYGLMVWDSVAWFMGLDNPSTQQVTFVSTVVGAAAVWFGFYVNSGNTPGVRQRVSGVD